MSIPVAQPAEVAGPGRAWLLVGDAGQAALVESELATDGWQVEFQLDSMQLLLLHLYCEPAPPDVLVCSLRFDDGDAFRLMRLLAGDPLAPALFFSARKPLPVLRSAVAMAHACGLQVAGWLEQPAAVGQLAQALRAQRQAEYVPARAPRAELNERQLHALIKDGRLQTWLQPQLRADSRELVRVEALMHAVAEDGTPLACEQLVPALRRHGLLEVATLSHARQTCAFLAHCLAAGMPLSASLNVPLRLLSKPGFCAELQQLVRHSGVDPACITIEVTEGDAAADLTTLIETTSRCRLLGFRLAIDDFGSAHSSLLRLSQLPFSELKLDRSLVANLDADTTRQALVACCAGLARGLGLRVVADGVETEAALHAAWTAGCAEVQGALLAPPMPMDAMQQWLRGRQAAPGRPAAARG